MTAKMKLAGGLLFRAIRTGVVLQPLLLQEFHSLTSTSVEFGARAAASVWRDDLCFSMRRSYYSSAVEQAIIDKEPDKETQSSPPLQSFAEVARMPATKPEQKPRLVVLGSGWGACRLLKDIDTRLYDVICVSPRNHMVFTPLLASTCVGTLEFRSVAEPVRSIQPALSLLPDSYYFLARCTDINTDQHEVGLTFLSQHEVYQDQILLTATLLCLLIFDSHDRRRSEG
jgi:hypothetical protein